MGQVKVGGETEAYCTACKMMREHIIVALLEGRPVKVECVHCHKQHVFRASPPGAAKTSARPARTRAAKERADATPAPSIDLTALIAGREPRAYDPKVRFAQGEVVRHPSFGVGVVMALPGSQKMEAAFTSGTKLLSHDRAAAAASTLVRPPRREDDERRPVTDAPPDRPR